MTFLLLSGVFGLSNQKRACPIKRGPFWIFAWICTEWYHIQLFTRIHGLSRTMVDVAGWYSPTAKPGLEVLSWDDTSLEPTKLGTCTIECSIFDPHVPQKPISVPMALGSPLRCLSEKLKKLTGKTCKFMYPRFTQSWSHHQLRW